MPTPEDALTAILTQPELLLVEGRLWLLTAATGLGHYDFAIPRFFACTHPWQPTEDAAVVARVGAHHSYDELFAAARGAGIRLAHTPGEHDRCSLLTGWYPLLQDLTPESLVFDEPPTPGDVAPLGFPLFLKGNRQTRGHRRDLSIIQGPDQLAEALRIYAEDPVLRWQQIVCRRFVPLRPVGEASADSIPPSFEFRTFWWHGELVGDGPYWTTASPYHWTAAARERGLAIAGEAARRLQAPFLVVDIAQASDGSWLVIECNDAQECGYCGVSPFLLWKSVLEALERERGG